MRGDRPPQSSRGYRYFGRGMGSLPWIKSPGAVKSPAAPLPPIARSVGNAPLQPGGDDRSQPVDPEDSPASPGAPHWPCSPATSVVAAPADHWPIAVQSQSQGRWGETGAVVQGSGLPIGLSESRPHPAIGWPPWVA